MRDEEIDEELRTHLEIEAEERMRDGMSRADADLAARRAFGSVALVKEVSREMRRSAPLERLAQDLRYACRLIRRNPGFASAVVLSIALGVGAETAVFSVVNAVLLRPLAFRNADRIVAIAEHPTGVSGDGASVSGPDFADFHDQNRSFERVAAFIPFSFPLTDTDEPIMVRCTGVSPDLFDTIGIQPFLGRVFRPEEYHVDGGQAILGYGFWQRRFGGDPHVLGRTIYLNHGPHEVIGVMPPTADLFADTDVWAKYIPDFEWARQRDNRFLSVIGLLRPGVAPAQAREDLQSIYRRVPGVSAAATVELTPLKEQVVGGVRTALVVLLGAVGLVLLVACANVGNLLLARGAARRQEIATRYALGASRARLIRQFVTESLLLAGIGGAVGVLLADAMVRLLTSMDVALPRAERVHVDMPVLLVAFCVSLAAGLVFSAAPAAAANRDALHDAVKSRGAADRRERWTRGALVGAELALAVVLLTGAGLLGRSFWRLLNVAPGFRADHVLTLRLRVPDDRIDASFYPELLERVGHRPGVDAAAVSDCMPTRFVEGADLLVAGASSDPSRVPTSDACFVGGAYFRALGIPLVAGRLFARTDGAGTSPVVIISESVGRQLWPGESPLGREIAVNYRALGRPIEDSPVRRTVVGVVGDVRQHALETPSRMAVYLPYEQDATHRSLRAMVLFVRTTTDPSALARSVQEDVRTLGPDVPVQAVSTLDAVVRGTLASRTFSLVLIASFAGVALLLAAGGLYGVVSYAVARRMREIGIRVALGARGTDVLKTVLEYEVRWLAAGLAAGIAGALLAGRVLRGMLFGVEPTDAFTFAAVVAVLCAVGALACWQPARRAVRTDPLAVLRAE